MSWNDWKFEVIPQSHYMVYTQPFVKMMNTKCSFHIIWPLSWFFLGVFFVFFGGDFSSHQPSTIKHPCNVVKYSLFLNIPGVICLLCPKNLNVYNVFWHLIRDMGEDCKSQQHDNDKYKHFLANCGVFLEKQIHINIKVTCGDAPCHSSNNLEHKWEKQNTIIYCYLIITGVYYIHIQQITV